VTITHTKRRTIADLEQFPQPWDDTRYEIIDGELFVASQPSDAHQYTCNQVSFELTSWSRRGGGIVLPAPGLIFADDDNAAPDVIWVSHARYRREVGADGKLHGPPELVVEVLSPGSDNERRDLVVKLALYARRGVDEYWIMDWRQRCALVHRRVDGDLGDLQLVATLGEEDRLESPLLPGFSCRLGDLLPPADWPVPQD
jgi:Uma2 family endonuclease